MTDTLPPDTLASRLKALADPVRLAMLEFLRQPVKSCCVQDDGVCACDFETFLGLSQPTISHHMKLLVQAGFVNAEKRGRWVYYELEPKAFEEVLGSMSTFAKPAPAVR